MLIAVYTLATLLTTLIRKSAVEHLGRRYVVDFVYFTFSLFSSFFFLLKSETTAGRIPSP
jgi:hypothetical protein